MVYFIVQLIALILGIIGMILTIVVTAMAQWRISYMIEGLAGECDKRIDGEWLSRWDGLWVTCVTRSLSAMQCNSYESLVSITTDLKAGRVLMSFAIVLSIFAVILAIVALLCCRCCRRARGGRSCLLLTAGICFILAAILVLIPIAWTTSNIIREITNPICKNRMRVEIGEAIFLGWPTILFLLVAGAIFCWYFHCDEEDDEDSRCKTIVYSSQTSLQRPVYIPCQTQEKTPSITQYSRSQYI